MSIKSLSILEAETTGLGSNAISSPIVQTWSLSFASIAGERLMNAAEVVIHQPITFITDLKKGTKKYGLTPDQ